MKHLHVYQALAFDKESDKESNYCHFKFSLLKPDLKINNWINNYIWI